MDKLVFKKDLIAGIQNHCKKATPLEAVGLIAGNEYGQAIFIQPLLNESKENNSFFVDPYSQFKAFEKIKERRLLPLALYHSHVNAPAILSQTDIYFAKKHNLIQIVISIDTSREDQIEMKAFSIGALGKITEFPIIIETS